MQSCEAQSQWIYQQHNPVPKGQRKFQKMKEKDGKRRKIRVIAMKLHIIEMSEGQSLMSHQHYSTKMI